MPRPLPNALTLKFNRLALIPLQLKREAMPPKKRASTSASIAGE